MESAGYEVETPVEGLLLVKNFVTDEEIKQYFEIINNATQADWEIQYTQGLAKFCMAKFGRDDVENLVATKDSINLINELYSYEWITDKEGNTWLCFSCI